MSALAMLQRPGPAKYIFCPGMGGPHGWGPPESTPKCSEMSSFTAPLSCLQYSTGEACTAARSRIHMAMTKGRSMAQRLQQVIGTDHSEHLTTFAKVLIACV